MNRDFSHNRWTKEGVRFKLPETLTTTARIWGSGQSAAEPRGVEHLVKSLRWAENRGSYGSSSDTGDAADVG